MSNENIGPENIPELSTERMLEIAIAYIKDDALRRGKELPDFNSAEMRERIKNTVEQKNLSEAKVTQAEALEFLRKIFS